MVYAGSAIAVVLVLGVGISRLQPAAPASIVRRCGSTRCSAARMIRQVRGTGTLVPEDLRWIPAPRAAASSESSCSPGSEVTADTVMLELSNPALEQELQDAQLKVKSAEAEPRQPARAARDRAAPARSVHLDHRSRLPEGGAPGRSQQAAGKQAAGLGAHAAAVAARREASGLPLRHREEAARQGHRIDGRRGWRPSNRRSISFAR